MHCEPKRATALSSPANIVSLSMGTTSGSYDLPTPSSSPLNNCKLVPKSSILWLNDPTASWEHKWKPQWAVTIHSQEENKKGTQQQMPWMPAPNTRTLKRRSIATEAQQYIINPNIWAFRNESHVCIPPLEILSDFIQYHVLKSPQWSCRCNSTWGISSIFNLTSELPSRLNFLQQRWKVIHELWFLQ